MEIRVPRLAEGVESATVVTIPVSEGDKIDKDQVILELETEKAVGPVPSPASGKVTKIHVKEGDHVTVGQLLISLSEEGGVAEVREEKRTRTVSPDPQSAVPEKVTREEKPPQEYRYESKSGFPPPAPPSLRKLAQQLGIDLTRVRGSEGGGRIALGDLKTYIQHLQEIAFQEREAPKKAAPKSIDFSQWGPVTRNKLSSLRRTVGDRTHESWSTIPHVTQFDEADVTSLMELREKYRSLYEKRGAHLTLTALALKAVIVALKKYPIFNASLDEATHEIVHKGYYHIGVAVDTESGLIVPVIRDVDKKSLLELSTDLAEVAERTRQRKASLEELQGGTFTLSNLGGIGGTHFTPIVNKPQAAVLGLGQGGLKPVVRNGQVEARRMLPVALSYDHRLIDGADGARFIKEVVRALENFPEEGFKV